MRRRMSLAGQLLALQLAIVSVVLVGVAAVSLAQSDARFRETAGAAALRVAESVAANVTLRDALEELDTLRRGEAEPDPESAPVRIVRNMAESARSVSGSSSVVVTTAAG